MKGAVWYQSCWINQAGKPEQVTVVAVSVNEAKVLEGETVIGEGRLVFERGQESGYPVRLTMFVPMKGRVKRFEVERSFIQG